MRTLWTWGYSDNVYTALGLKIYQAPNTFSFPCSNSEESDTQHWSIPQKTSDRTPSNTRFLFLRLQLSCTRPVVYRFFGAMEIFFNEILSESLIFKTEWSFLIILSQFQCFHQFSKYLLVEEFPRKLIFPYFVSERNGTQRPSKSFFNKRSHHCWWAVPLPSGLTPRHHTHLSRTWRWEAQITVTE